MFQVEKQRFDTGLKTKGFDTSLLGFDMLRFATLLNPTAKATVLVEIQYQHRAFRLYL